MDKITVLMSVYKNENPDYFQTAMDSILNQTLQPDEIILIRDGEVPQELQAVINKYICDKRTFTYIPLNENKGLGNALRIGVERSRNELIARMDTDDIAVERRLALQLDAFEKDPKLALVGGQIIEFEESPDNPTGKRMVPVHHQDILQFMRTRSPFNHMSVMFRKSSVLNAGNYKPLYYLEDYYLWCRMALDGYKFSNLSDTLAYVRVGSEMYHRRGGYKYFKSWKQLEKYKYRHNMTNIWQYMITLGARFSVQVLMPNKIRGWLFRKFGRNPV